jgi:hypothetical protein
VTAAVIPMAARRRIPCPQCEINVAVADLDAHLRYGCRVLAAKRRHPSNRTPDGVA